MGKPICPTERQEQAVCPCGCGFYTNRAPRTDKLKKWIRGEPLYKLGHNSRTKMRVQNKQNGAWYLRIPEHPNANGGHILEHRFIASNVLGRPLKRTEQIHHVNGDPSDNRNENLVICENQEYHAFLHLRTESMNYCGNTESRKCVRCKKYDDISNLLHHSKIGGYVHENCRKKYKKEWYYKNSRTNRERTPQ